MKHALNNEPVECEILIHTTMPLTDLLRIIYNQLGIDYSEGIHRRVTTTDFIVTCGENMLYAVPSLYTDELQIYSSAYFNYRFFYQGLDKNWDIHLKRLSQVLLELWRNKVPAATNSVADEWLPHKGGNDEQFIFWFDPQKPR